MDYRSVIDEIESWPVDERVRLVEDLWDRLSDQGAEPELDEDLKAELDRRIEESDRNPGTGVPWEVVKARILTRFQT
jgi:putative addiction module component (TIGR02574 family)